MTWIPQRQRIRPEGVVGGACEPSQTIGEIIDGKTAGLGVAGSCHDTQQAVFRERTGRPWPRCRSPPTMGAAVKRMIRVHEGDEDIDVEQMAHGC